MSIGRWLAWVAIGVLLLPPIAHGAPGQAVLVRWDIVTIDFSAGTVGPGGVASALAEDGSKITVTGSGTFVLHPGGPLGSVTGGGTWQTFGSSGAPIGSGTYMVTGLVRWEEAPGAPPGLIDLIGGPGDPRAGLAVLHVTYSDGDKGILVVSCHLVGTPDTVFEGVTASKGFVAYWNREAPPAPPGDANRTLFHR